MLKETVLHNVDAILVVMYVVVNRKKKYLIPGSDNNINTNTEQ